MILRRPHIKKSWTKGGRERSIPILTEAQRIWLEEAKKLVQYKSHSLIPADTTYKTYRKRFEKSCERAGIDHRHGLRHAYAQRRYQEITGFPSISKGGPSKQQMTPQQRQLDRVARLQVSNELGHTRINISNVYL